MKAFIFCLLLTSCQMYTVIPSGEQFENEWQIINWIQQRVEYRMDYVNYWRSPREVLRDGYGDCEDFTLLFMAMVNEAFGWKPEMLLIFIDTLGPHYLCRYDGYFYDATWGFCGNNFPFEYVLWDRIEYDLAMWWATLGYTKSINKSFTDENSRGTIIAEAVDVRIVRHGKPLHESLLGHACSS